MSLEQTISDIERAVDRLERTLEDNTAAVRDLITELKSRSVTPVTVTETPAEKPKKKTPAPVIETPAAPAPDLGTTVPKIEQPTLDDVKSAAKELNIKCGRDKVVALIQHFNVENVPAIPTDKYAEAIAFCRQAIDEQV